MAAGDFSCATLVEIKVKAEQIWADNQTQRDYMANVDALKAILAEQTAQFPQLKTEKDEQVKIVWLQDCHDTVSTDCSNDCNFIGAELETGCQTHTLTECIKDGFIVKEKALRSGIYSKEELIARGMLRALKNMDEKLTQAAIAQLDSFAGANQFLGGVGNVVGNDTFIAPANFDANIFGYFIQAGIINKFKDTYVLSGNNLFQSAWQADMMMSNPNAMDLAKKFATIRKYFDLFNIDSILAPEKATFLIDRGAVAFVSKAYYPTTPVEYLGAGQIRYSVASQNLPGVMYDVIYSNECLNNEIIHKWNFYAKYGIFNNPKGCNTNVTGVLKFLCGIAP